MAGTKVPSTRPGGRDEQGAVAIVVGICVLLLAGIASFAVDLGYQRVAKRDMQAVADIVAMDMARQLENKSTNDLVGTSTLRAHWDSAVGESLARNAVDAVGAALSVVPCDATTTDLSVGEACAHPGILQPDGAFVDSGAVPASHVRVLTRTSVDYFLPVFAESGAAGAAAFAKAKRIACFQLGSYAARVQAGDSAIGPLLGAIDSDLNLDLVSYQGLASADVVLSDLAVALGVGTVDQMLSSSVTLGQFYAALASAMGPDDTAQVALLQSLSAKVGTLSLVVGDLFAMTSGGEDAGAAAEFNVLDLVSGAAIAADGQNGVRVEELGLGSLPLVGTSLAGGVAITESRRGCGTEDEATASTAQVAIDAHGDVASLSGLTGLSSLLCLLSCPMTTTGVDVQVRLASATGVLRAIRCPQSATLSDPEGITVDVTTDLTSGHITMPVTVWTLLGTAKLRITTRLGGGNNTAGYDYHVPPRAYGDPVPTGTSALGFPSVTVEVIDSGGLLSDDLLAVVTKVTEQVATSLVDPLVSDLNNLLLGDLADALGLSLGGADLFMYKSPNCSSPRLVG